MDIWIVNKHLKSLPSPEKCKWKPQQDITIYRSEHLRKKKDTELKMLWNNPVVCYQLAGDLVQF